MTDQDLLMAYVDARDVNSFGIFVGRPGPCFRLIGERQGARCLVAVDLGAVHVEAALPGMFL